MREPWSSGYGEMTHIQEVKGSNPDIVYWMYVTFFTLICYKGCVVWKDNPIVWHLSHLLTYHWKVDILMSLLFKDLFSSNKIGLHFNMNIFCFQLSRMTCVEAWFDIKSSKAEKGSFMSLFIFLPYIWTSLFISIRLTTYLPTYSGNNPFVISLKVCSD